jgi:hypothetical protein
MSDVTIDYDLNEINNFIETVFHAPLPTDAHVFTQSSPTAPRGYGLSVAALRDKLDGCKVPMPSYFGASVVSMSNGNLRYRRDAFKHLAVVVLDDIGTKIPLDKFDGGIDETYVIETSEGNFQYGLVLDVPIEDYDEAQLLLDHIAAAGITDKGGCMPCKKVRLPCGINGKKGDGRDFKVKLHHMDGPYWTPEALLKLCGSDITWEELRAHASTQRAKTKRYGAVAWSKVKNYNAEGVFDPVLEWLYTNDMVVDDTSPDGWIEIFCPWMDQHTGGDNTAGYSPIGYGNVPNVRGFKCFHDHCSGRKSAEFLAQVHEWGGPHMPVKDPCPELSTNYVLDTVNDMAWNVRLDRGPRGLKTEMLRKTTPDVFLPRDGKSALKANPVAIWMRQPQTVQVEGTTYDPTDPSPIVRDENGAKMVNVFKLPDWPIIRPDMNKVQPFLDFLHYLIPEEEEREYFLKWLACKAKWPEFRGVAMIMVAKVEGTGRNTLMQIIGKVWGQQNVTGISIEDMLHSQWTDWRASLFVHVDESVAMDDPRQSRRVYDRLKELVDPMTTTIKVNAKYSPTSRVKSTASMMFFSNHEDALHTAGNSRRFYGVRNPYTPADAKMFGKLREWMGEYDKRTDWEAHVWNFLRNIEVDRDAMLAAPKQSQAMKDIVHASRTTFDILAEGALACWDCDLVSTKLLCDAIEFFEPKGLHSSWRRGVPKEMQKSLFSLRKTVPGGYRLGANGKMHTLMAKDAGYMTSLRLCEKQSVRFKHLAEAFDRTAYARKIQDWAVEQGYDLF